jgi:uncharacterized protein (DUF1810 family)
MVHLRMPAIKPCLWVGALAAHASMRGHAAQSTATTTVEDCADDPFHLHRFFDQAQGFPAAIAEIREGRKCGHWSWWFFPVAPFAPNGTEQGSTINRYYALRDSTEALTGEEAAKAFLAAAPRTMPDGSQVSLRRNYLEMMTAVVEQFRAGVPSLTLVGSLDQSKLRSSLELFQTASRDVGDDQIHDVCAIGLQFLDNEQQGKLSKEMALDLADFL